MKIKTDCDATFMLRTACDEVACGAPPQSQHQYYVITLGGKQKDEPVSQAAVDPFH